MLSASFDSTDYDSSIYIDLGDLEEDDGERAHMQVTIVLDASGKGQLFLIGQGASLTVESITMKNGYKGVSRSLPCHVPPHSPADKYYCFSGVLVGELSAMWAISPSRVAHSWTTLPM